MDLEKSKELPVSSETGPESPPKIPKALLCWCFRVEPYAYAIHIFHFVGSLSFLGLWCLLADEAGLIDRMLKDAGDLVYANLFRLAMYLSMAATVQGFLLVAVVYAAEKRHLRVLHAYLCVMLFLTFSTLAFLLITTLHTGGRSSWIVIVHSFLKRMPVFGLWALNLACLRQCFFMTKNPQITERLIELIISMEIDKTSA